jgi:transketolase
LTIRRESYQCDLYRYKEGEDLKTRQKFEHKLEETDQKVAANNDKLMKKHEKRSEDYNKHLKEVYKKYEGDEKRHRADEKEEALKLRKELQEFYDKEADRKCKAEARQIAVGTCFQDAVSRLDHIHRRNEDYSRQREDEVSARLARNSHYDRVIRAKRRSQSAVNQEVGPLLFRR